MIEESDHSNQDENQYRIHDEISNYAESKFASDVKFSDRGKTCDDGESNESHDHRDPIVDFPELLQVSPCLFLIFWIWKSNFLSVELTVDIKWNRDYDEHSKHPR